MSETDPRIPWSAYYREGRARALALGNRGEMRFDKNGHLAQNILDAYHEHGFYVFTGVLSQDEIIELTRELDEILDNAPVARDKPVDRHGRPSKFAEYYSLAGDDPAIPYLVSHPIMMKDAALRACAHPDILKMVASVNGPDFVPYHETIHHKVSRDGPPTNWHQDGRTHWTEDGVALEHPDGSGKTHGFNLSIACSSCIPENCLWIVPGSQRQWRLANNGKFPPITEQIAEAVPALMAPGDCVIVNRSSLHGAYPNKSSERRVALLLGYHKRDSAIDAETTNVHAFVRPAGPEPVKYSEEYVLRRARMVALAIDARRQRYPDERAYEYEGSYIGAGEWNKQTRAEISKEGDEYWRQDITL